MTAVRRRLVFATRNRGKVAELRALVAELPLDVVTLDEAGVVGEVEEDGATFEANARKKALAAAEATGEAALADDSGLEVDALGGAPGVRSARYADAAAPSDAANNAKLLAALAEVPPPRRARFRSTLVLAHAGQVLAVSHGALEGEIVSAGEVRGAAGFGYDPLFLVPSLGRTLGELPLAEKNRLSHRGVAMRGMLPYLRRL